MISNNINEVNRMVELADHPVYIFSANGCNDIEIQTTVQPKIYINNEKEEYRVI